MTKEECEIETSKAIMEMRSRIAELEKENAELKSKNCWKTCEYAEPKSQWISQHIQDVVQLTKAKEIIKDYITIVNGAHTTVCGVPEENRTINVLKLNKEAEQFLNGEVEKTIESSVDHIIGQNEKEVGLNPDYFSGGW